MVKMMYAAAVDNFNIFCMLIKNVVVCKLDVAPMITINESIWYLEF